jgi:hypothetical protein
MEILPIMEHHPANIEQITIGNFMVGGGNLGTIRGENTMAGGSGSKGNARIEGFQGAGYGKEKAIAPVIQGFK